MASSSRPVRWRDQTIIDLLAKVSRCRPLNDEEQGLLDRTIRRVTPKRAIWRWHADEDRKIKDLMARRRRRTQPPKLFHRNDEIRLLAIQLGRTEWAVRRRMERIRKAKRKVGA
jgi:hypothetical protein